MKVTVISVGKLKEGYLRAAVSEYQKRLSRYCNLEIIELIDEKTPDFISDAMVTQIKDKEGKRILARIREKTFLIPLAIDGNQLSSEEFASFIQRKMVAGISDITFVIGGSLGLSEKVMNKADMILSFSKLTFPHQIMRVLLLEQIYRGFRIITGEPYHK